MISYILELTSYDGISLFLVQSQKDLILQAISLTDETLTIIQSQKTSVQISFYSKNIEILTNMQEYFLSISSVLTSLANSSNPAANASISSDIAAVITNLTTTIQALGKIINNDII
jgi:hypothetical protein